MRIIAKIHNYILHLNDKFEYNFSDKDLHFLVIGLLGMAMIFVVYPVFKWLASKKHIMVIAWIYVFTLILVITFAIEIGQKISNTGSMEFADIVFGVMGFIVMFAVFAVVRGIYHAVRWFMTHRFVEKEASGQESAAQEDATDEKMLDRNAAEEKVEEGKIVHRKLAEEIATDRKASKEIMREKKTAREKVMEEDVTAKEATDDMQTIADLSDGKENYSADTDAR